VVTAAVMAAALNISAIVSLSVAAQELLLKGRFARSAEKFALAAEAARALGAPDCLVVAHAQARRPRCLAPRAPGALTCRRGAQLRQAEMLLSAADLETPERKYALRHRVFMELLPPLMAVLERRRCADTLLYGKCAPHEMEWSSQYVAASPGRCSATDNALFGQYVGYEAYLLVTRIALHWLYVGCHQPSAFALPTPAQTQQIFCFAATALDLMSAPRLLTNLSIYYEVLFLTQVQETVQACQTRFSREDLEVMMAALGRLTDSGVIEDRRLELAAPNTVRLVQQLNAKAEAEKEAPGLRSCAHCSARELHVAQFKRCSACKAVVFCSKDCQLANWPAHKAACKAARKAAADAATID